MNRRDSAMLCAAWKGDEVAPLSLPNDRDHTRFCGDGGDSNKKEMMNDDIMRRFVL